MSHLLTIGALTPMSVPAITLDETPLHVATVEITYRGRAYTPAVCTLELTIDDATIRVLLEGFDVAFLGQTCRATVTDFRKGYGRAEHQVSIEFQLPMTGARVA